MNQRVSLSELFVKGIVIFESCEIKSFLSFPKESSGVTSGVSGSPRILSQAQNPAQNLKHGLVGAICQTRRRKRCHSPMLISIRSSINLEPFSREKLVGRPYRVGWKLGITRVLGLRTGLCEEASTGPRDLSGTWSQAYRDLGAISGGENCKVGQ